MVRVHDPEHAPLDRFGRQPLGRRVRWIGGGFPPTSGRVADGVHLHPHVENVGERLHGAEEGPDHLLPPGARVQAEPYGEAEIMRHGDLAGVVLRQRQGVPGGRVEEVDAGVGGEEHQAVAMDNRTPRGSPRRARASPPPRRGLAASGRTGFAWRRWSASPSLRWRRRGRAG